MGETIKKQRGYCKEVGRDYFTNCRGLRSWCRAETLCGNNSPNALIIASICFSFCISSLSIHILIHCSSLICIHVLYLTHFSYITYMPMLSLLLYPISNPYMYISIFETLTVHVYATPTWTMYIYNQIDWIIIFSADFINIYMGLWSHLLIDVHVIYVLCLCFIDIPVLAFPLHTCVYIYLSIYLFETLKGFAQVYFISVWIICM